MPPFKLTKRKDLIAALRKAGSTRPESGGRHQFMLKGPLKLIIPSPHEGDISIGLLNRLLKQAGITREDWEDL